MRCGEGDEGSEVWEGGVWEGGVWGVRGLRSEGSEE